MEGFEQYLDQAILTTQACQRNWNLKKEIPKNHVETIVNSMTLCPSKQNLDFYSLQIITDRDTIKKIYYTTQTGKKDRYNPQVLANMLVIFSLNEPSVPRSAELIRQWRGEDTDLDKQITQSDQTLSIGIAAGIGSYVANLLGYRTGFCSCFDSVDVQKILQLKVEPFLMLGIGYPNIKISRNVDQESGEHINSYEKLKIKVEYI